MSSASSNDETNTTINDNATTTPTHQPVVVFPWRHEELPLPRWVKGTQEYEQEGHLLFSVHTTTNTNKGRTSRESLGDPTMNMLVTAFMFLEVPLYQILFFSSWKEELAENMSWAFPKGVAGLLSHVFLRDPTTTTRILHKDNNINDTSSSGSSSILNNETNELCFHATVGGNHPPAAKEAADAAGTGRTTTNHDNARQDEEKEAALPPLQNIMQQNMIDLYDKARKESPTKEIEICLKMYPHTAELVSLYAMPYISRQNVQKDPKLLSFYRELMSMPAVNRAEGLTKLRQDKLVNEGMMETTVIAQVLIWCNEIFFVKDVESGTILQGSDDQDQQIARNVCHLLRMESTVKTTKTKQGTFRHVQEDWIITDIDDLLSGNLIV